MASTLKYKFFDTKQNRMVTGDDRDIYIHAETGRLAVLIYGYEIMGTVSLEEENLIPLQSLGVLDANSNEIYYGDILEDEDGYLHLIHDIKSHAAFIDTYHAHKYLIVGNMYEHPNLLGAC